MFKKATNMSTWGVGTKITAFTFALVGVILGGLIWMISHTTATMLTTRSEENVQSELRGVQNMVGMFHLTVSSEATSFANLLASEFSGAFTLDPAAMVDVAGKSVPTLAHGGKPVNLDFSVPDQFTKMTGGSATVFAASGDDFVRVSTSLKNEKGERAVGTVLDRTSAAYARMRDGQPFSGLLTLFGKQYMTQYDPIKDASGKVIGILFVGVDITKDITALKDKIKSLKVGTTGYYFVLNSAPGKALGNLVVHPLKQDSNIIDNKDANGHTYIREILEKKTGTIVYPWQNAELGDTHPRDKRVSYVPFAPWNWVIVGGSYVDEITAESTQLRNRYITFGLVALVVFAVLLFLLVRATVTRPLTRARDSAMLIADGDLTVSMDAGQQDEIGRLAAAMNGISRKLSMVVGDVRDGAEQIAIASQEIASGNQDLCSRTEDQAANLAATASSMEELTVTVRQNADNARQANQMALSASAVAQQGGAMVAKVVDTMASINQSSRKIVDIISVIDGIAFQTNILALNAAVEAARAGEQGRGFAVVASEVRNLAQRSAAAAKEIKQLIGASVDQVDAGSKLVAGAGATMDEVLASVSRVTDIMAEISAASIEQTGGIEHVNKSIGKMDEVTQQNAALVEQASAAAEALQEQAAELAQSVRLFKLAENRADSRLAAPTSRLAISH
ncbi:methyl-accepting chemotaxis protein [Massilia sp. S19_KUP03_FR1]|uniref:methyl-accepting chemotaxis protein n=1 Tax=Massilia sp. S19_KUP03_FR1 TaxID=3025503 RepID=UPI002FCDC85C